MLLLALIASDSSAQTRHYWIMLRSKNALSSYSQSLGITERALKRRAKSLPPDRLIDDLDIPISESALSQIRQIGVKIRTVSRWLNAVSVEASTEQLQRINALPIVSHCEPVVQFKRPHLLPSSILPHATRWTTSSTAIWPVSRKRSGGAFPTWWKRITSAW